MPWINKIKHIFSIISFLLPFSLIGQVEKPDTAGISAIEELVWELIDSCGKYEYLDYEKGMYFGLEAFRLADSINFKLGMAVANLQTGFVVYHEKYDTTPFKYLREALRLFNELDIPMMP